MNYIDSQLGRMAFHVIVAFSILVISSTAHAQKGGKGGGGSGGGGDSGEYIVLHLSSGLDSSNVDWAIANDVNEYDPATDHQDAVGVVHDLDNVVNPFFWRIEGETVTPIPLLDGGSGSANPQAVNDNDQIAGYRVHRLSEPVIWPDPFTAPINLTLLPGHEQGKALAINKQGVVVGFSQDVSTSTNESGDPTLVFGKARAVAWHVASVDDELLASTPVDLGSLFIDGDSAATGVAATETLNSLLVTRIGGTARKVGQDDRAVMWEVLTTFDEDGLPSLAVISGPESLGTPTGASYSTVTAMNDLGDVCGDPGYLKPYGEPMQWLADLKSDPDGNAYPNLPNDLNNLQEAVGIYRPATSSTPVLWQSDGAPVDLDKFTAGTEWATFIRPQALNTLGAIVGAGRRYSNGKKISPLVWGAYIILPK